MADVLYELRRAAYRAGIAARRFSAHARRSASPAQYQSADRPLDILGAPWRLVTLPEDARNVQTMLSCEELQLLYWLASRWFKNEGEIVDAGCFLGGSTTALAAGMRANPRFQNSPRGQVIHSYDLFEVEAWTVGIYFPEGTEPRSSFRKVYEHNIGLYADLVDIRAGDITTHPPLDRPIEILFIDLAKHWTVSDFITRYLFPKLIPGHSVVVQQDYLFDCWNCWLFVTMEYFADYFEIVGDTGFSSVVFRYMKQIPERELQVNLVAGMTQGQIRELTHSAMGRFRGHQRDLMSRSLAQFQSVMDEVNWPKRNV